MAVTWKKIPFDDEVVKHSLATAASDFLVASGAGAFVKKTLAETQTILGVGNYTDYSGTSTVIGWASTTGKQIFYKKMPGGLVHFWAFIVGWAYAGTAASFTLPDNLAAGMNVEFQGRGYDNGVLNFCLFTMAIGSNVVTCTYTLGGLPWTSSTNNKIIIVTGAYQAA